MDVKVADEVWIACALLHKEFPMEEAFPNSRILERIKEEKMHEWVRPGVLIHISSHCISNRPAQPNSCRFLYRLPDGRKRLFKDADDCHPSRQNGRTNPNVKDIPEKYLYLIEWYQNEYRSQKCEKSPRSLKATKHYERCPKCKQTIKEILEHIYDEVKQNYKLQIGASPLDFYNKKHFETLKKIHKALQEQRGFQDFIKAKTLPNCDFFVPNPGFVVEFDESQHFTSARKLTLELYPKDLKLGFDRKKWIALCSKVNSKDNNPPYRDEQRAWYDTLRDFLPEMVGLKPTIRLFAKDHAWCCLNPANEADLQRFKRSMQSFCCRAIAIREDSKPTIARIILTEEWSGNLEDAKEILDNICSNWPQGKKVLFLIT